MPLTVKISAESGIGVADRGPVLIIGNVNILLQVICTRKVISYVVEFFRGAYVVNSSGKFHDFFSDGFIGFFNRSICFHRNTFCCEVFLFLRKSRNCRNGKYCCCYKQL